MTGREDVRAFGAQIDALVRPLVGLDLSHDERRALTAVACLDAPTALVVAGLMQRARQARPLRTTTTARS
ncbi:hypothetical protein GCM10023200_52700 [Actinomycetospora chlora]|uniref:Uncharacterized protein n=1 Tax=Actinomycetospora chlora TaxID=663608 RepID=A0ABP9CF86_9PSEU